MQHQQRRHIAQRGFGPSALSGGQLAQLNDDESHPDPICPHVRQGCRCHRTSSRSGARSGRLHAAGLAPDNLCPLCPATPDTIWHRAWECATSSSVRNRFATPDQCRRALRDGAGHPCGPADGSHPWRLHGHPLWSVCNGGTLTAALLILSHMKCPRDKWMGGCSLTGVAMRRQSLAAAGPGGQ